MDEILNNYKLFILVFLTTLLIVFILYRFFFEKEESDEVESEESLYQNESDEEVFQRIKKLLPPVGGSIFFLQNNDMTMVFHKRSLSGLYEFYKGCKKGNYIFKDENLESLKNNFYLAVEEYLFAFELNAKETSIGYYKVQYNIDGLHVLVDKLLKEYESFIKVADKNFFGFVLKK